MRLDYQFRKMSWSDDLVDYLEERAFRLRKHQTKPFEITVTFTAGHNEHLVDMHLRSGDMKLRARASGETFYEAVDMALERMSRQMARKKSRIQDHKCHPNTHWEKVERWRKAAA